MPDPVRVNDLIVLSEDLPQNTLLRGRIGRILEVTTLDEFYVDFVDDDAHTIAKIHLKSSQLAILRHQATLEEDQFWKMVEKAKSDSAGDGERQVQLLVDRLAKWSIADIFAFGDIMDKLKDTAYYCELWTAAVIICGGCSDDGFTDFRAWLIAQGKQIFYDALRDPEILIDVVPIHDDQFGRWGDAHLEHMNYVHWYAYEKKTGEATPIFFGQHPLPDLRGEWWDDETAQRKYPKLTANFRSLPSHEFGEDVDG